MRSAAGYLWHQQLLMKKWLCRFFLRPDIRMVYMGMPIKKRLQAS
jgi:hypothetical protein